MSAEPIAWALLNTSSGKVDHRCYQREDAARAGAKNQSNRWRTFVAVPLFLHRDEEGEAMLDINRGIG